MPNSQAAVFAVFPDRRAFSALSQRRRRTDSAPRLGPSRGWPLPCSAVSSDRYWTEAGLFARPAMLLSKNATTLSFIFVWKALLSNPR